MSDDVWNPTQYHRFRDERSQPFFDLLSLVEPSPGMRVADLGCGTGELTKALHERLAAVSTVGIDRSDAMLAKARAHEGKGLTFETGDLRTFGERGAFDLVFSNAALQWADGHEAILGRLAGCLRPGGQLAVQVPANHDHPTHLAADAVAREEPFESELGGYAREPSVRLPEAYSLLLDRLGFERQHVRLQVYLHHLASREGAVEWVKGTLLTDYERRLRPDVFAAFLERYRERLFAELDDVHPYPYPFKRILFWGRLPGTAPRALDGSSSSA